MCPPTYSCNSPTARYETIWACTNLHKAARSTLTALILTAPQLLHIAVRFGLRWHSLLTADWLGLAVTTGLYAFCCSSIYKSACERSG